MSGFADNLAAGVIACQHCTSCGTAILPARARCPACGSAELAWRHASGRGTVWSVTTIWRAPTEALKAEVPYDLVLVTLDEGPRLMGRAAAALTIGDRVMGAVVQHGAERLVQFAPLAKDDAA